MARTTVRVNLPEGSPDDTLHLIEDIIKRHDKMNTDAAADPTQPASPLPAARVAKVRLVLDKAKTLRAQAKEHDRKAQELNEQAGLALGLGKGQTLRTPDTGMNHVTVIRDLLLAEYAGQENALEPFGFQVVVGTAASPKRKA
jgi:hypothetical protein